MRHGIPKLGSLFAAAALIGTSRRVHDLRRGDQEPLSRKAAYDAHRKGAVVWEQSPNGNRQSVNPFRRDSEALKRAHGVTSGRQWVKLRKRLQRGRRQVS